MIRLLVWLVGDCVLILAIYKFGYYRELAALTVLSAAVLWILGGALFITHGGGKGPLAGGARAAKSAMPAEYIEAADKARADREAAK